MNQPLHTHRLIPQRGMAVETWTSEVIDVEHDYRSTWATWEPYTTHVATLTTPYQSGDGATFVPTSNRVIFVWRAFDVDGKPIAPRCETRPVNRLTPSMRMRRWADRRWATKYATGRQASEVERGEYRPTHASKARREVGDALAVDAWSTWCDHLAAQAAQADHVATFPDAYGPRFVVPVRPVMQADEVPANETRADRQARRLAGGIPTRVVEPVLDADGKPTFDVVPVLDADGKPTFDDAGDPITTDVPITREVLRAVPVPYSDPFTSRPTTVDTSRHSYHATLLLRADDPTHRHPTGDVRDRRTGALRAAADPITRFDVRQIEPDSRHVSAGKRLAIVDRPAWRGSSNGKPIRKPSPITLNRHAHRGVVVIRKRGTDEYGVKLRDAYVPTLPVALYSPLALNDPDAMHRDWDLATIGLPTDVWHVGLIGMTPAGGSVSVTGASPMLRRKQAANTRRSARARKPRASTAGKRGPAVGPFTMSARSLPEACKARGLTDHVATLESILRTSADGAVVTFGNVTVTIAGPAQVIDETHGAYPVREWARRAAIAGVVID